MGLVIPLWTWVNTALIPPGLSVDPTAASVNIWNGSAVFGQWISGLSMSMFFNV